MKGGAEPFFFGGAGRRVCPLRGFSICGFQVFSVRGAGLLHVMEKPGVVSLGLHGSPSTAKLGKKVVTNKYFTFF